MRRRPNVRERTSVKHHTRKERRTGTDRGKRAQDGRVRIAVSLARIPARGAEIERFVRGVFQYLQYPSGTAVTVAFMPNAVLRRLKKSYLGQVVDFVDVLA